MIEFLTDAGRRVDVVALRDNTLVSGPVLRDVARAWLRQGNAPDAFEDAYASWTNGYNHSQRVPDDTSVITELKPVVTPALVAAGGFDEVEHPRDGKGRFAKKAGGALSVGKKLKITHGLIHSKHEAGKIIAVNGSGKKRVVWDGNKYLLQEKDADGGWPTVDTAIKSKAYARVNEFDSEWHEPGEDGDGEAKVDVPAAEPKPKKTAGGGKKSAGNPGDALKITHGLVHQKHEPGTVIAENADGSTRVKWNGKEYELQVKDESGSGGNWETADTFIKSKAYARINELGSNWVVPKDDDSADTGDDADVISEPKTKKTTSPGNSKPPETDDNDLFFDDLASVANAIESLKPAGPQPLTGYKKVGGQAGSNTGGLFQAPDGQKWYVKAPKTDSHARNEVLANRLYEAAGVKTPQVELASMDNGPIVGKTGLGVKSKIIDGDRNLKSKILESESYKKKVHEDFAVDAWLGNWDTVGLGYDNIITDTKGDPVRIDAGGALLFRAQGGNKGSAFGDKVDEIDSLRKPSVNAQAANVFADITDDDIRKGVAKIEAITPEQIDAMVDDIGFTGKLSSHLKSTLKARRQDLIDRFGSNASKSDATPAVTPTSAVTPVTVPTPASSSNSVYAGVEPKSMFDLTKVKDHKNGAIFADPGGIRHLVTPQQSEAHARNQFLAANLYNFAGVAVERTDLVAIDPDKLPGKSGVGTKTTVITPSEHADVTDSYLLTTKSKEQLAQGFAIDAWLGNWNVAGTSGENLVVDKQNNVHRTNVGGSLLFRANGGSKELSDTVDEIDSLRNPNVNSTSAKIFANVTDDDIRASVLNLEKLQPSTIDFIVDQSGFTGSEAAILKKKLKARRQDLINRYGSMTTVQPTADPASPAPSSQPTATNALGGAKTFTALQKAKVQSIFAKNNVKWYNKTNTIYDSALEVSKTHPDLTLGDALDIMDQSLKKKSDNPFRTKVEKWLKTNAGMHHAIATGGSAPLGGTSSTTSPSTSPKPKIDSSLFGKPLVEFATPLPRDLTVSDADILQERMNKAWPPPWNASERAALKKYTGDAYVPINNCLRGIGTCTPATQSTINSLRKAMKPSTDTVVVHRKTNPSAFGLHHGTAEFANLHKSLSALVGKTFEDKGVTSTSIRKGAWHGLVEMEIEVPKGAKIAWVKRLSQHTHEDEIILAPGTRFEVISVENTPNPKYPGDQTQRLRLRIVVDEV